MMVASVSAEGNFQTDPEGAQDRGYFFRYFFGAFQQKTGNMDFDIKVLIKGLTDALRVS